MHHCYIGTEHILLGLLKEGTGVASQVLADNGVEYDKVLELIEELIAPGNAVAVLVDGLSPRAAHVLEVSKAEAARFHSEKIGTEHLLIAMIKEEGNVLLLDEPTNDIDVNTLRALEEGLEDFAGCAVVISHDRWFLDRICTHILAFEGDSNVFFFEGSYSEYEENKLKRLGKEEPTRVRYRKLMND